MYSMYKKLISRCCSLTTLATRLVQELHLCHNSLAFGCRHKASDDFLSCARACMHLISVTTAFHLPAQGVCQDRYSMYKRLFASATAYWSWPPCLVHALDICNQCCKGCCLCQANGSALHVSAWWLDLNCVHTLLLWQHPLLVACQQTHEWLLKGTNLIAKLSAKAAMDICLTATSIRSPQLLFLCGQNPGSQGSWTGRVDDSNVLCNVNRMTDISQQLTFFKSEDDIWLILSLDRHIGGDNGDWQSVDAHKLLQLCCCCAGHSSQLFVAAEEVLQDRNGYCVKARLLLGTESPINMLKGQHSFFWHYAKLKTE